uniref:XRN_M domain-containing protein n=1 Tax=Globodera pallida TaxID=36090 RepID=A0A183CT49_GLOPA
FSSISFCALPQRVGELFQMYDSGPFFSSAFLRDKMPPMMFPDRMDGLLERDSHQQNGAGGVVRHIPIRLLEGGEDEEK